MYQFISFTQLYTVTDFKLPEWFTGNTYPFLEFLYHVAMRSVANISEEYVASIFRARYGQKVFDKLQALNTLYRPDVSENKCTHFKIKDTLKNNSLTIYKISKFFNPKMQGHTHTHTYMYTHACTGTLRYMWTCQLSTSLPQTQHT